MCGCSELQWAMVSLQALFACPETLVNSCRCLEGAATEQGYGAVSRDGGLLPAPMGRDAGASFAALPEAGWEQLLLPSMAQPKGAGVCGCPNLQSRSQSCGAVHLTLLLPISIKCQFVEQCKMLHVWQRDTSSSCVPITHHLIYSGSLIIWFPALQSALKLQEGGGTVPKAEAERAVPKAGPKAAAKLPSSGGPPPMPTRAQMQVCPLLVMHDLAELTHRCVACVAPTCDMSEATAPRLTCRSIRALLTLLLYIVACCPSGLTHS